MLREVHYPQIFSPRSAYSCYHLPISKFESSIFTGVDPWLGDTRHCSDELCSHVFISTGGVVALGKFDALHIGHRALAEQAARMGSPVLLSFAGMGEVLGWQPRYGVKNLVPSFDLAAKELRLLFNKESKLLTLTSLNRAE